MEVRQKIKHNHSIILRCLDPSKKLMGRLWSVTFLGDRIPSIKKETTIDDKIDALLQALLEVPDDLQESVMNDFIAALRSSGQDHVANIFHQESGKVPMSDKHHQLLNEVMHEICQFLEPRDGLIDWLLSNEVFTRNDSETVHSAPLLNDMARKTIEILQRKSDDSFDRFISALHETEQSHVVHILTGTGRSPMSKEHRKLLQSKKKQLEMFCDPVNGVVSELIESDTITHHEEERIFCKTNLNEMVRELVEILMRKSDDAFHTFVIALNKTGQNHVSYILSGEGESRPLGEERIAKLKEKRSEVVRSIYAKCLVSTLMSKGVFSSYDQHRVESQISNAEKVEMIVDLITRKSQSDYDNFIATLRECDHEHVVEVLVGPEVVAKIQTGISMDDVDEDKLRDNIQQAFNNNETDVKVIQQVLSSNGISVADIQKGSIIVKFRCRDHAALASLEKLYTSKRLDELFTDAFCSQFAEKGLEPLTVQIADEEFERHKEHKLMTEEHRETLLSSEKLLVEKLTVNDELLDKLSLCPRRRQTIERAGTPQQQVKTLLDIVSRQPDSAFTQLLHSLTATGQHEAAIIISGGYKPAKKSSSECNKIHMEDTGK